MSGLGKPSDVGLYRRLILEARQFWLSLRDVAAELAKRGYLNERGKEFSPSSVQSMLA